MESYIEATNKGTREYPVFPEDMVVRTVANKSKVKIAIIHAIDRKIPLDEIARSHGFDMPELLEEIEAIVNSGTRINVKYFIDEILDEDQQSEIIDYFMSSESGSIDDAVKEFDDEYTPEEIRLVRIRFLSEMGY
ncbi:MAG: ATP-dependent DNA helicase RecQ, partial [Paramuribaculum sp.]|nr:ATP-dependent DNA helicase RecQ [Paramuribaculum sp.]